MLSEIQFSLIGIIDFFAINMPYTIMLPLCYCLEIVQAVDYDPATIKPNYHTFSNVRTFVISTLIFACPTVMVVPTTSPT